jgi:hypothetical protein
MAAFKLHEQYCDPAVRHISSYFCQLFVMIGKESLQYCVLDSDRNKFIALADYRLSSDARKTEQQIEAVHDLISSEEFLIKNYPSVVTGFDTPYHTLVPASLFDQEYSGQYLGFNFNMKNGYHYLSDRVEEIEAVNVGGISPELKEIISSKFSKNIFVHRTTGLIKAANLHQKVNPPSSRLFLFEKGKSIELFLFDNNKPLLINTFPFKGKEDILYYSLFVLEQAGIQPDQAEICIGGMLDEGSDTSRLLQQYAGKVTFISRPANFAYSAIFDHLPIHRYIDLFALALCGS